MIDIDAIPFPYTVLRHCRCQDCANTWKDVHGQWQCRAGIGGTVRCWATGKAELLWPRDGWHWCRGYKGRRFSEDVWLWPLSQLAELGDLGRGAAPLAAYSDVS